MAVKNVQGVNTTLIQVVPWRHDRADGEAGISLKFQDGKVYDIQADKELVDVASVLNMLGISATFLVMDEEVIKATEAAEVVVVEPVEEE